MRTTLIVLLLVLANSVKAQDFTRQNDSRVSEALSGLGLDLDGRAWGAVPAAFEALYPNEFYDEWSLSGLQARAVAYIALLIAVDADTSSMLPPSPPTDARAEARALASIALAQLGGIIPPSRRNEVADQFADAAGAAGRADCTALASFLAEAAQSIRQYGSVFSGDESGIRREMSRCR